MSGAVLVFARTPELGRVKTRLAAALGAEAALALHRAFLADGLAAARASGARVLLARTPGGPFPEAELADERFEQRGAGFGERLDHALAEAHARAGVPLVVVGSDTPHLPPAALRTALARLAGGAPAVIGPSLRGGFHLAGFASAPPPIAPAFEGPNEAARLARLLRARGLAPELVGTELDVDLEDDLRELVLRIELARAAEGAWVPRESARVLEELGLLSVEG